MNRTLALALALLAFPSPTLAQAPPEWTLKVQLGKPIFLTTASGERVEGVAGQVTPDAVVVSTPTGIRTVPYRDLRRAEKRDSVWNGVGIGAATGAGLGIAAVSQSDCQTDQCASEEVGVVIGGALYGSLIGWGIDGLVKGKTTIFEPDAPTTLTLVPRRGGFSARVAINW